LPTLYDVLNQLGFVSRELAVLGLFISGTLIILVRDWRVTLLALLSQYIVASLILVRVVAPEIAVIKMLVGALICPMLYLAARQSGWSPLWVRVAASRGWRNAAMARGGGEVFRASVAFRLLAAALAGLLAMVLNRSYPLPIVPPEVGLGCYWLMVIGCFVLILTEAPLKAGPGLLTLLIGFELLYTHLERSLVMIWLLAVTNLLLTLAVVYLAVVWGARASEGEL
jgi:hypothetical protein